MWILFSNDIDHVNKPYNVYRLNVQIINIKNYVFSEETKYSQKATQKKNVSPNMVMFETFLNCYVEKVQKSVTINLNFKADPISSAINMFILHSLKNITKKSLSFPKRNTIHFLCSKTAANVIPLLHFFRFRNSDDSVALYMEFPMNVNGLVCSVLVIPSQISHVLSLQHFK